MESVKKVYDDVKIRIYGLSDGLHEYHFSVEPAVIRLDNNFQQFVEINAKLEKAANQLYLKAEIETSGNFQCDRCLDEFTQQLSTSYQMFYVYNAFEGEKIHEEEMQLINPDTVDIDLSDDIRQMILFSVPLKLLCNEECKGLCPRCGTNLNHRSCDCKEESGDPRFQGLHDLLSK